MIAPRSKLNVGAQKFPVDVSDDDSSPAVYNRKNYLA